MTDVKHLVDLFLQWRLPRDFRPDAGISFTPSQHQQSGTHAWPTGTNLLDANQAEAMVRFILEGSPAPSLETVMREWDDAVAWKDMYRRVVEVRNEELDAAESALASARERIGVLEKLIERIIIWAEQRCPCHDDAPPICPLCGADVTKDRCMAADVSFPRSLLADMRLSRALSHKDRDHG